MTTLDALEAELAAHPDDEAAFSVYADALLAAGDWRGELVAIQRAREVADSEELAQAEARILAQHGAELLGLVADGLPHPTARDRYRKAPRGPLLDGYRLVWGHGHVRAVEIAAPFAADPAPGKVLRDLLERPAGRFVQRIVLERYEGFAAGPNGEPSDRHRRRGVEVVDAIAARPRPALRALSFGRRDIPFDLTGDYDARDAVTHAGEGLGALDRLWPAVPGLREVLLSGCHQELGTVALPELRSFELRQSYVYRETLEALARAQLPKLERLVLWLGAGDYGEVGYDPRDLAPLCDPSRFPALRHLGFVCSADTEAIATMVLASPIAAQLETLDLSGGTLTSAAPLIAERCAHLRVLDVRWNCIGETAQLERAIPQALVAPQREPSDVPRFNACQE